MSTIEVSATSLSVRLTRGEKLLGLLRDQVVPRTAVTSVDVVPDGITGVRGLRSPGLGLPRRRLGTWRRIGRTQFVDVRRGEPALRVRLEGQRYDELLLGTPAAHELAAQLGTAG